MQPYRSGLNIALVATLLLFSSSSHTSTANAIAPPEDIIGFNDTTVDKSILVRSENFNWVVKDSAFKSLTINFLDSGKALEPTDFSNVNVFISNVYCPSSSSGTCLTFKFCDSCVFKDFNIQVSAIHGSEGRVAAAFDNVVLNNFAYQITDITGRAFRNTLVQTTISGGTQLLGVTKFDFHRFAVELESLRASGTFFIFNSDTPFNGNTSFSMTDMLNTKPSSRSNGNSALGADVIVPAAADGTQFVFSNWTDLSLRLHGKKGKEYRPFSVFSGGSQITLSKFKTTVPIPSNYYDGKVVEIIAHFTGRETGVSVSDFDLVGGGGSIRVGGGSTLSSPKANFTEGSTLTIEYIRSALDMSYTMIDLELNLVDNSHATVKKCINVPQIFVRSANVLNRSSILIEDSSAVEIRVADTTFFPANPSSSLDASQDASRIVIRSNAAQKINAQDITTTSGYLEIKSNVRSTSTPEGQDAMIKLYLRGDGDVSLLYNSLRTDASLNTFGGSFELWADADADYATTKTTDIGFNNIKSDISGIPRRVFFSGYAGDIILYYDENSVNREDIISPSRLQFGCARVYTKIPMRDENPIPVAESIQCTYNATVPRCDSDFWFYKSVARREYILRHGVESCTDEQPADIPEPTPTTSRITTTSVAPTTTETETNTETATEDPAPATTTPVTPDDDDNGGKKKDGDGEDKTTLKVVIAAVVGFFAGAAVMAIVFVIYTKFFKNKHASGDDDGSSLLNYKR